jgi:hypothetical protein
MVDPENPSIHEGVGSGVIRLWCKHHDVGMISGVHRVLVGANIVSRVVHTENLSRIDYRSTSADESILPYDDTAGRSESTGAPAPPKRILDCPMQNLGAPIAIGDDPAVWAGNSGIAG